MAEEFGDIDVDKQLGSYLEQSVAVFYRKGQLHEIKMKILDEQEKKALAEEQVLMKCIQVLKDQEAAHVSEKAAREQELAEKGRQFQELTALRADWLAVTALEKETGRLHALIRATATEAEKLAPGTVPVDSAEVSAAMALSLAVQRRFERVRAEHERLCARVQRAVLGAHTDGHARGREAEDEAKYRQQLEEAIEDMSLLQVDVELAMGGAADAGPAGGDPRTPAGGSHIPCTLPARPPRSVGPWVQIPPRTDAQHIVLDCGFSFQQPRTEAPPSPGGSLLHAERMRCVAKLDAMASALQAAALRNRLLDAEYGLPADVPDAAVAAAAPAPDSTTGTPP